MKPLCLTVALVVGATSLGACSTTDRTLTGAAVGGGVGALAGSAVAGTPGALVGGAAGAATGVVVARH